MYDEELKYLDKMIKHLSVNIFLSEKTGLFSGQAGVMMLLYYYSRHKNDRAIQDLSDKLLDSVVEKMSNNLGREIVGIALSICFLMKERFVEPDVEIFEEVDDWLFNNEEKRKEYNEFNKKNITGLYIDKRLSFELFESEKVWKERLKNHFRSIYSLLCNCKYNLYLPIIKCSELLILIHLCSKYENNNYFKHEIDLIYKELDLIVEIAVREDRNNSDKYLLFLLLSKRGPKVKDELSYSWETVTLMDIIHFYLNRFLLGLEVATPSVISEEIALMIKNQEKIDGLISLLSPNTSGLDGYIGGFSWALFNWILEQSPNQLLMNDSKCFELLNLFHKARDINDTFEMQNNEIC